MDDLPKPPKPNMTIFICEENEPKKMTGKNEWYWWNGPEQRWEYDFSPELEVGCLYAVGPRTQYKTSVKGVNYP